jgi:hypothetical protein
MIKTEHAGAGIKMNLASLFFYHYLRYYLQHNINMYFRIIVFALLLFLVSCTPEPKKEIPAETKPEHVINVPAFSADSAYTYVKAQVDFGPRVPLTKAHADCAEYLVTQLKQYADSVILQNGMVATFDNKNMPCKNIIAQFNPQQKRRVLLCAHWDTRPWSDSDTIRKDEPNDGASDGASGVGVLLELARQLKQSKPAIGIDIIMLDMEDYGEPNDSPYERKQDTYGLGTQYWAKNPHVQSYYAEYGILLDMVGARNATFSRERYSLEFASSVVTKVWNMANQIGYSDYFLYRDGGYVTDDHYYINTIANIPCIDLIQLDLTTKSGFGSYHHTHADNMSIIDKNTLKAVGQTLLHVIYSE